MIRVSGFVNDSITDGSGLRFVVFTQGCPHRCEGCHNPQTHDFNGGYDVSEQEIISKIDANPIITGVTFSGGEPLCKARELLPIARYVKQKGLHLAVYTGYTIEEILEEGNQDVLELLGFCDIMVDGRFVMQEKSYELRFKGSANQRVLDVKKSLVEGRAVLTDDERWLSKRNI